MDAQTASKTIVITNELIDTFTHYLRDEERSPNTIAKYARDVTALAAFLEGSSLTRDGILAYKNHLHHLD